MSNVPKSKEDELQNFIKLLFLNISWLRTQIEEEKIDMMGIFTIKVPLFGHRTQGLCFCYFPNMKYKWNKLK